MRDVRPRENFTIKELKIQIEKRTNAQQQRRLIDHLRGGHKLFLRNSLIIENIAGDTCKMLENARL